MTLFCFNSRVRFRRLVAALCILAGTSLAWGQTALYVPSGSSGIGTSSTGNVGIGTSNPTQKLTVEGNSAGLTSALFTNASSSNTAVNQIQLTMPNVSSNVNTAFRLVAQPSGDLFRTSIVNNGTEQLTVLSGGSVGIGTTAPGAKLDVVEIGISAYARIFSNNPSNGRTSTLELAAANGADPSTASILRFSALISQLHSKFHIQNSAGSNLMTVLDGGNVGIGTISPAHKLAVNGTIKAKEVIVVTTGWSDYVFAEDYRLAPLAEVETHIREKGHLPGIPSAAEVEEGGVSLGEMQAKLLAKVEELTLHLIRIERENAGLRREVDALKLHSQP